MVYPPLRLEHESELTDLVHGVGGVDPDVVLRSARSVELEDKRKRKVTLVYLGNELLQRLLDSLSRSLVTVLPMANDDLLGAGHLTLLPTEHATVLSRVDATRVKDPSPSTPATMNPTDHRRKRIIRFHLSS